MFRDGGAKRPATDDDEVEWPHVAPGRQLRCGPVHGIRVGEGFIERVADVATEHVEREVGGLRARADIHVRGSPVVRASYEGYVPCLRLMLANASGRRSDISQDREPVPYPGGTKRGSPLHCHSTPQPCRTRDFTGCCSSLRVCPGVCFLDDSPSERRGQYRPRCPPRSLPSMRHVRSAGTPSDYRGTEDSPK